MKVPGPGSLVVRGKGIKRVEVHPEGAGAATVRIRPRAKARRRLSRKGEADVRISVTYTPPNGGANTRLTRIELRRRR